MSKKDKIPVIVVASANLAFAAYMFLCYDDPSLWAVGGWFSYAAFSDIVKIVFGINQNEQ